MAKRIVFGRRTFEVDGQKYKVELRADGLHITQSRKGREIFVSPSELACIGQSQFEFSFINRLIERAHSNELERSKQAQPVSDLREEPLVRSESGSGPVHEGGEQPPQGVQDGGSGVASPVEGATGQEAMEPHPENSFTSIPEVGCAIKQMEAVGHESDPSSSLGAQAGG